MVVTLQASPMPDLSPAVCPKGWDALPAMYLVTLCEPRNPLFFLHSANVDTTGPLPSLGCQDTVVLEGDAALVPALCPNLNGSLKMPGPPGKAGAKRRPCCQGDADGDIVLLSAVYPRHEEYNHGFPLPATELGATALVTTKTTQNCTGEDRA